MAKKIMRLIHRKGEGVYTVTIPKAVVETMGWDDKTEFALAVNGKNLILKVQNTK
ncbi:MAG: hypothetical protein KJ697_03115 [Nanoarchaeota archaeon]|nr:hypothetical protein [Nanoarchaeota archaeon]MBU4123882.1 hypothetical protein [Nanoarchaeota archaeon]